MVSVPVVYAEVGSNYDTVINDDGTTTWTSHPDRIMDSTWQNYFLETDEQKIIFKSNSIGGLIYDIPTCSYSLYENGYLGNQVIPSVSFVGTQNNNGTWENLPVNNESCLVSFTENNDGITITSIKENDTQKLEQELIINIKSGVKETFKLWDESNNELGISQTIHTDEEIIIGNTVIPIAQYSGQFFDRQFIIDNTTQILQLTDSISYDFDEGINSLSNLNIIFDESSIIPYKVNLDFSNGNFTNYLEIDPTFGYATGTTYLALQTGAYGSTSCSGNGHSMYSTSNLLLYMENQYNAGVSCGASAVEYDITSISDSATITDVSFKIDYDMVNSPRTCNFNAITTTQPSTITHTMTLFNTATGGTSYINNNSGCQSVSANNVYDLGTSADTDLQNKLTSDWFAIGIAYDTYTRPSGTWAWVKADQGDLELQVTYTVPTAPTAPQNFAIDTQDVANEITLNWTAPSDDGGSSITGYKVYLAGSLIATLGDVLTYDDTISGGEIGSSLVYHVKATNAIGDSVATSTVSITAWDVPDTPATPTGVTGTNPVINWVAPSSDDTITGYKLYRDGSLHATLGNVLTTTDSNNISSGTTYAYAIKAISAVGESATSSAVNLVAGVPPDPPTSISATIANTATAPFDVVVTWSSPSTVGTGTLSNFQIFRDGVSQGTVGLVTTFANTVPSSGTYAYTVKAISDHGTSVASSADSITTPSAPSQPTLTVTVLSDTSHKLDWSASSANGSTLQGYKIEYSLDNSLWSNYVTNTGNTAVTRTATSLNVDDQYYWRVSGINGVGAGTPSSVQNAWTLLSAPTNLVATSISESQINLSWTGISGISSYTIQYESPTGNGFSSLDTGVSSSDTTYSSTSLTTGTQYNYRIFGISTNSGSNSVNSNESSANTFGILPAPVLDLLTSVAVNPATVQLDWTASTGNPVATGYKIERDLGSGWITIETDTASTSTTYLDVATSAMNEPKYRISSINSYGTSSPSNELTLSSVVSGGSGGGGGSSSKNIVTAIDELLNLSILGNNHIMTVDEFVTGKIPVSWDSGDNLSISKVTFDDSNMESIKFNIEHNTPIILQGSGNSFSSDDITYTISTPNKLCNAVSSITTNCMQEKLYELPITVTATSQGDNISQTTLITIDTRAGFGGETLALFSIFVMVIVAGVGIIKFARKSSGKRNHSTNGKKKSTNGQKKARKSVK